MKRDSDKKAPSLVDVTKLGRPSTLRYRTLVLSLIDADQELAAGAPALKAAIDAMQAVSQFVGSDPTLRVAGVSTSLRRLLAALDDTAMGGKPRLLFDSDLRAAGKRGRPTRQSADLLRGTIVYALSELIAAGMKNKEAAQFLEKKLKENGARYRGKPISVSNLLQWREQTGDSAPAQSDEAAKTVAKIRAQFSALPRSLETAQQLAGGIASIAARYDSK